MKLITFMLGLALGYVLALTRDVAESEPEPKCKVEGVREYTHFPVRMHTEATFNNICD